ncbi:MAG: MerR family transcriptional regulator [Georgenia sp.]
MTGHMQIGEVAERTGLSLRTIRYYGEVDLVSPSSRSDGGFRLYTVGDVEKLELVKQMKPLDFSIEEMKDVLTILGRIRDEHSPDAERERLLTALADVRATAAERSDKLRAKLAAAEAFVAGVDRELSRRHRHATA